MSHKSHPLKIAGRSAKYLKNKLVAKLVTENRQPCVFCQQDVDDEVIFGKLYSLGDIQCHYFCVLLSCCLVQKGKDTEGLFGFLYKDILAEVERSKKHKCSYCGQGGASLGCCVSQCRKQFHLPCGRQKNVISLFYGNYKSFCELHAPKQKISADVMANAKVRMKKDRMIKGKKSTDKVEETNKQTEAEESATVCVICYEAVPGYPSAQTFWPPCCGRDAWLHRACLQRMALSAGMHYLKCPLCNDKEIFYDAVCEQGYYLPDRDAAWELEQDAFAEMYSRPAACAADHCQCPFGRAHDEPGPWDVQLCVLCGGSSWHARCGGARPVCAACRPAAAGLDALAARLAALAAAERARTARARRGPRMPGRMSLRRTKGRAALHGASTSSQNLPTTAPASGNKTETPSPNTQLDRQELNLKTPKRAKLLEPSILQDLDNRLLSPIKMLEQRYMERLGAEGQPAQLNQTEVIERMRARFNKPRPLSEKKRIVNEIVEDLFKNVFTDSLKSKDFVTERSSPKKCIAINEVCEDTRENKKAEKASLQENKEIRVEQENETVNTDPDESKENNVQDLKADISVTEELSITNKSDAGNEEKESDENKENETTPNENTLTSGEDESAIEHDESSNSTFQLPPEFIAESDDSLPVFDTPKKLKTVDIEQNSSLEISEHNEGVSIDVVEMGAGKEGEFIKRLSLKTPVNNKMCSFKFSPIDKETLQANNVDIDVESFKDRYLNEVDRDSKCNYNDNREKVKLGTVIGFAADVTKSRKRKLGSEHTDVKKRRDGCGEAAVHRKETRRLKKMRKREDRKRKSKDNRMRIRLKEEKKSKNIERAADKTFKQFVLKFSPVKSEVKQVIRKPEKELTPLKRKYVKTHKSPDTLVQTSIQSFFKVK